MTEAPTNNQAVLVMLVEYRSLRREIEQSIRLQHTTFGVGIPLLSVGLGLSAGSTGGTVQQVIRLAVPPIAFVTLALWLVEMARMMRAGNYLHLFERRLNEALKFKGLVWESWLRSQVSSGLLDPHIVHRWAQGLLIFLIGSMAGLAIWMIATSHETLLLNRWVFVAVYTLVGVLLVPSALPVVFHSRKNPVEYVLSDERERAYGVFRDWLGKSSGSQ